MASTRDQDTCHSVLQLGQMHEAGQTTLGHTVMRSECCYAQRDVVTSHALAGDRPPEQMQASNLLLPGSSRCCWLDVGVFCLNR